MKSLSDNWSYNQLFQRIAAVKVIRPLQILYTYKTLILEENNHVLTFQQQFDNHNYATLNRAAICIPLFKRANLIFLFCILLPMCGMHYLSLLETKI